MSQEYLDGAVRYPDTLPCPQIETDLQPRERRYLSDIGGVHTMRRFQRTFQATRQNISFVLSHDEARIWRDWYKLDIIEGGAWFYADWPILHKETDICYRFVTRPVWRFLARGFFHVSATVEIYERKAGRTTGVYTSKLYPVLVRDNACAEYPTARTMPSYEFSDNCGVQLPTISASISGWTYSDYKFADDMSASLPLLAAKMSWYIYGKYFLQDGVSVALPSLSAEFSKWRIQYDYYTDNAAASLPVITEGVLS